jgi:hypothetical protein
VVVGVLKDNIFNGTFELLHISLFYNSKRKPENTTNMYHHNIAHRKASSRDGRA